jgi:transposase
MSKTGRDEWSKRVRRWVESGLTAKGDMRRSFDALALAAQEHLGEDPQTGAVFVFCNKRRHRTTRRDRAT